MRSGGLSCVRRSSCAASRYAVASPGLTIWLAVACAGAAVLAGCSGSNEASTSTSTSTSTGASSPAVPSATAVKPVGVTSTGAALTLDAQWPLTGKSLDHDAPEHPVYVVKMDNTVSAQPQVGLGAADMVVEELVEGGLTRLAAFYYENVPHVVGPVRSMRASDIGIVKPVDADLVASGAANPTIRRLGAADIATFTEGTTGFYRDDSRTAPYNLFMSLDDLASSPGSSWQPPKKSYLNFGAPDDFAGHIPVTSIDATFSTSHTTHWELTAAGWTRPDSFAADADDFAPDTIVLLRVKVGDAGYLDPSGSPVPETEFYGSGEAVLVHGDRALTCTWHKVDKQASVKLATKSGTPVDVPSGHTWIELIPADTGRVSLHK
ncbi:MAG: DUF3048 domain-containing protein [Nocardioidaceae bacterium]